MYKWFWLIPLAILSAGCVNGLVSGLGSGDYERREARQAYEVRMGVVENVRSVRLEGTESGIGAATATAVGGIVASNVKGKRSKAIGSLLGTVAGGLAGAAIEEALTRKPGLEITVRLDSGRTIAVVQEDTGERFTVGERVRVLESSGQLRVTH